MDVSKPAAGTPATAAASGATAAEYSTDGLLLVTMLPGGIGPFAAAPDRARPASRASSTAVPLSAAAALPLAMAAASAAASGGLPIPAAAAAAAASAGSAAVGPSPGAAVAAARDRVTTAYL